MDLFAAALQESACTSDVEVKVTAALACSHGLTPSQGMAAIEYMAPSQGTSAIVDIEATSFDNCIDIAEVSVGSEPIHHQFQTPEKVKGSFKRPSCLAPEPPGKTKRILNPMNSLKLTSIKFCDGDAVTCAFVGDQPVPVPLWGQYSASWRGFDFGGARWVLVSNYECWVMNLVNAITNKSVREVAKDFADHFRTHFSEALRAARKVTKCCSNPLEDSESEDFANAMPARSQDRQTALRPAVLEVIMGEFKVTALNSLSRLTLKIDEATLKFIAGWIVPLVRFCAKGKARSQEVVESAPSTAHKQDDHGGFHLDACVTPNVRGKVSWNPTKRK